MAAVERHIVPLAADEELSATENLPPGRGARGYSFVSNQSSSVARQCAAGGGTLPERNLIALWDDAHKALGVGGVLRAQHKQMTGAPGGGFELVETETMRPRL